MFDKAFWNEFFDALYPEYHYENITSPFPLLSLNWMLIGLYVGIIAALILVSWRKGYMGNVIRSLLKAEAFSEETAKSPEELGLEKKPILKRALKRQRFGGLVKCVGVDLLEKKPDFSSARYYIPEDRRYRAEDSYSRRGVGVPMIIFWAIVLIPVFMVLRFAIPELLQLVDNFITGIS